LKGHVSIKNTCAGNVILFIMAAPKVGKGIVGKVGNVGGGKSGISHFSQKGEKKCSFPTISQNRFLRK
jgi:hypothetical protein